MAVSGLLDRPEDDALVPWIMVIGKRPDLSRIGPFFCPLDEDHFIGKVVPWLGEEGCTSFIASEVRMSKEAYASLPIDHALPMVPA